MTHFPSDLGFTNKGIVASFRAQMAIEIVKHCALVTGYDSGEDSTGRSKISLMDAEDVAKRAVDIADELVTLFEKKEWIRATTMTRDDDWREAGRLEGLKSASSMDSMSLTRKE